MPKSMYVGVDGLSRIVGKMYVGVDGIARKVVKGYIGVDGIARLFFDSSDGGDDSEVYYALLYEDGTLVFQLGSVKDSDKALMARYSNIEPEYTSTSMLPWSSNMENITGVYFNSPMTANTSYWFYSAKNLRTVDATNLTDSDMSFTYYNCYNLTSPPVCGPSVTNMVRAYFNCQNITGNPVCGLSVTDMEYTYTNCRSLTGSPVCGENVTSMWQTYANCFNMTGFPVCGDKVTTMYNTYAGCTNLTGSPVCGPSVNSLSGAYRDCVNLTGAPVCGDSVTNMASTYVNCYNLTGAPVCGPNVTDLYYTYRNCTNLCGNMYMYSSNVQRINSCFNGRDASNMLNIYVSDSSVSLTTLMNYTNASSIIGRNCTWTHDAENSVYYNTFANIYIYPVANVYEACENNGDTGLKITSMPKIEYSVGEEFDPTGMELALFLNNSNPHQVKITDYTYIVNEDDVCVISCSYNGQEYTVELQLTFGNTLLSDYEYVDNGDGTYTIVGWNGTLNGEPSTEMVLPDDSSVIL